VANPQLENGYFKISNELWQVIVKTKIPGEPRQIFDHIIRKTYGWRKKECEISYSQFESATNMPIRSVRRGINKLIEMNLISVRNNAHSQGKIYSINKHYKTWQV
jgi:phage replication O-like protein O